MEDSISALIQAGNIQDVLNDRLAGLLTDDEAVRKIREIAMVIALDSPMARAMREARELANETLEKAGL
jgi:hypothetical protein